LCNLSRVQIVTGHSGKKDGIEKEKDEKLKPKTEGKERKVVGGQKKKKREGEGLRGGKERGGWGG